MDSNCNSKAGRSRRGAPCDQCVLAAQCPIALSAQGLGPQRREVDVLPRSYGRGSRLQREGEPIVTMRFIKSGLLAVRQTGIDGVDRAIAVIGPGHLVGQPSGHGLPAVLTIQALTPVSVCEFPFALLKVLMQQSTQDLSLLGRYVRQSVVSLTAWSHLMRMPGLPQRMATALRLIAATQPALTTQIPSQSVLAELLCVTRESVNRLWKDFEAQGIVKRRLGRGVDLDISALERLSSAAD